MHLKKISSLSCGTLLLIIGAVFSVHAQNGYTRDPNQPIDEEYTKKIKEYTTEDFFLSPLID